MRGSRDDRPGKISTHSAHEDGDQVELVVVLIKRIFQPTPPTRTETINVFALHKTS